MCSHNVISFVNNIPLYYVDYDLFLYPTLLYTDVIGCFICFCIEVHSGSLTVSEDKAHTMAADDVPEL